METKRDGEGARCGKNMWQYKPGSDKIDPYVCVSVRVCNMQK